MMFANFKAFNMMGGAFNDMTEKEATTLFLSITCISIAKLPHICMKCPRSLGIKAINGYGCIY